jgi:hypothetical protein
VRARGPCSGSNHERARTKLIQQETITCPFCWETIEIAVDLSVDEQRYVEDCSVCCRPIVIAYRADNGVLTSLDVAPESDA